MNSLDDLRSTLDRHADAVTDLAGPGVARAAAVHQRVRVVRRRRRAVAAGGVAAVIAAVGGVALLPDGARKAAPEPADTVVGLTPPAQLSSLGFTYAWTQSVEGEGDRVSLQLRASDTPRLVTWATSGDDDRVVLDAPTTQQGLAYDVADFSDFYYVAPGSTGRLTVRAQDGVPGIAVYTLGDARPDGITTGGVTFRQAPAGRELLGAAVGERGESEVVVPATSTSRGVEIHVDCATAAESAYLVVDVGGSPAVEGAGCGDALPVDAVGGGSVGLPTQPGEDATVRAYLTDGRNGPRLDAADARLSVGVYARTDSERPTSRDSYLPVLMEHDGHLWRQVSRVDTDGTRELEDVAQQGSRPVLAQFYLATAEGRVTTLIDGRPGSTRMSGGMSGGGPITLVEPGQTVTLRISGPVDPKDALSLAFYEQVD